VNITGEYKKSVVLRVSIEDLQRLERIAEMKGITIKDAVRQCLESGVVVALENAQKKETLQ
jgi:predicted DNA binding CopG/RHH family protein